MASSYFPVGLLDQPWGDEDSLGTLSSLERRQRKAAEKSDINAFYKFLGIVFVTLNLVLLGSELYTFATEPSRGLTGAFLLEIGRMSGVAYVQLQNLYKAVGDVAWTGIAVVYGHDFAQRGVSIADSAAQLLANGLYYLALALSVLVMYYVYPGVSCAPLRTAALSTLAAAALFGAPPLYAWLVSLPCQSRNPEPVVLWALLFGAGMCFVSLSIVRAVGGRTGPHATGGPSAARHRGGPALRRQTAPGPSAAGSGAAAASGNVGAGITGSSGGGAAAAAAGGQKRSLQSRTSSIGRNAGSSGLASVGPGDGTTQPSVSRSVSSTSLAGSGGLLSAITCFSGGGVVSGGPAGSATDPVGIHPPTRVLHRAGSRSHSSVDLAASSATSCPPHSKQGIATTGAAAAAPAASVPSPSSSSSSLATASCGRGRPVGHQSHQSHVESTQFDPVGAGVSNKLAGSSSASRNVGSGGTRSAAAPPAALAAGVGGNNSSVSGSRNNSSNKQRQQQLVGTCGSTGSGTDGSSKAKPGVAVGLTPGSSSSQARSGAADAVAVHAGGPGGGASNKQATGHHHTTTAKQHLQHDPSAAAPYQALAAAGVSLSSSSSTTPGGPACKKKGSNNPSSGGGNNSNTAGAAAQFSSAPAAPVASTAAAAAGTRQQQSAASAGGSVAAAAANGPNGTANRHLRPEVSGSKPTAACSFSGLGSGGKGTSSAGAHLPAGGGAGGLLSRLTASVVSVATAAPVMTGRSIKKAALSHRPQGQGQMFSPVSSSASSVPPPPQYIIVPPPPPPPPRKSQAQVSDSAAPSTAAVGAAAAASPATGVPDRPVRNPWLNPNPVIKLAASAVKGSKDVAAGAKPTAPTSVPAPPAAAAAPAAGIAASRSSGGAAATQFGVAASMASSYTRSASCGGAGAAGVTSADPQVLDGMIPHHVNNRQSLFADAAVAAGTSPQGRGGAAVAAVVEPVVTAAAAAAALPPALGVPASAFLLPQAQECIRNHFQSNPAGPDTFISATIVSTDASVGPLVAHKHASGDLDIASVAANYFPYPSSFTPTNGLPVVPPIEPESADSFSLFSTPPPLITSEATVDPVAAAAAAASAAGLASVDAADATPCSGSAHAAAHMLYNTYGTYGHYAPLPSLSGDPLWSHNVPSVFGPPGLNGFRASHVPPPGFPSHAYGGVFASGPIPGGAAVRGGGGGWDQLAAAVIATAANGQSDVLPLPPAGENGILASLGFVDDGNDDGADVASGGGGSGGGGDDAAASCAICWSAPRQVGFLHGKTSHLCVCRRCAAKLREGVHRCPMCRQRIERIIDIY